MELTVVAAVFCSDDKVLCLRRAAGRSMAGLWEFPGGKVERGEALPEALVREIKEELQVDITVGSYLGENRYTPDQTGNPPANTSAIASTSVSATVSPDVSANDSSADATLPPVNIMLHAFQVDHWSGQFNLSDHDQMLWSTAGQMRSLHWSPADVPFVDLLCERLAKR